MPFQLTGGTAQNFITNGTDVSFYGGRMSEVYQRQDLRKNRPGGVVLPYRTIVALSSSARLARTILRKS